VVTLKCSGKYQSLSSPSHLRLRFASKTSRMHPSDEMTLSKLVPQTAAKGKEKPKGKAKGQSKAKQEAGHTALDRIIDDQQSEMHRDALIKETRAREDAEEKTKAADAQVRVKEQQLLIAEQQLKLTREMLQREAHAAHIARQSALHHSNCLQIEYSTRKEAEEKASSIEAEKRRLELDLAEAESSLKRKQSETECASSSSYQAQSVNDTITKLKYEEQEKGSEKTHKQKRNERRRAMEKHKQDRICDAEM